MDLPVASSELDVSDGVVVLLLPADNLFVL